ncbi:MAG: hypothetical protein WDW21_04935 [Neisseriaceae bacterium]
MKTTLTTAATNAIFPQGNFSSGKVVNAFSARPFNFFSIHAFVWKNSVFI